MNGASEFVRQLRHHWSVLRNPAHAGEFKTGDADAKMRIATLAPASMPPMFFALVYDFKMAGSEFEGKFFNNRVANRHKDYRFEC